MLNTTVTSLPSKKFVDLVLSFSKSPYADSKTINYDTGLPTKDETPEKTGRNLFRLIPYIHSYLH